MPTSLRRLVVCQLPSLTRGHTDIVRIVVRLPVPADTLYDVTMRDQASDPATGHGTTKGGRSSTRR